MNSELNSESVVIRSAADEEEQVIDLMELFELLMSKIVLIIIVTAIGGAAAFAATLMFVTPKYSSSAMMYVNTSSLDMGSTKIQLSDLTAAKSLAETYSVILKSRTTLQMIIDQMGLQYDYKQLGKMISTSTVNNTEVFQVTVTAVSPTEAEKIANCILDILPRRINSIMEGSNVMIVDTAIAEYDMVSPNFRKNTMIGALGGFVLCAGIIVLRYLLDTTIHSEDFLLKEYKNIPLLTVVPQVDGSVAK